MTDTTATAELSSTEPARGHLTRAQLTRLLEPVRADRVESKQGLTYVPQHEVRAELMRIFGPGNVDHTMHTPQLLWELEDTSGSKPYYRACYMVGCTLRIRDYEGNPVAEFTEYHVEANSKLPDRGEAHAMAVTSAQSYALRRAAISLGDAFGLHLYDKGSLNKLVKGSLMLSGDPESPLYVAPTAKSTESATPAPEGAERAAGALLQGGVNA